MANRYICCNDCYRDVGHSQRQWRKKVAECGSIQKYKRRYRCRDCKRMEKHEPLKYQLLYGSVIKKFRTDVRNAYRVYFRSERTKDDILALQNGIKVIFNNLLFNETGNLDMVLHTTNKKTIKGNLIKLDGITIQNYPMVGDHYVALTKKRRSSY